MKAKLKSIFISLLIFLTIIIISHFISKSIGNYDKDDFRRVYILSFVILYLPIFISICLFKKESSWRFYFKAPIISFFIVYFLVFVYFKELKIRDIYSFLETTTLVYSFLGFFASLFMNVFLVIKFKSINNNKRSFFKVNYSIRKLLLIPLLATVIYSFLIVIGSSSFINAIHIWSNFLPLGIILAFVTIKFFNYLYQSNLLSNKLLKVVLYYLFGIVFFALISMIPFVINKSNILLNDRFYEHLVVAITLFGPFYLFIISVVHIYYLKLVSKVEKEQLTQQSLESQLNYQQLKNQISPHFLFNNINVLTSLIEENPKKAVLFSENLSHIYRYFLEQEKQDVVLVKDEIAFAKSYLELLKDRFEIGFNYSISVDENVNEKYIVATILQQVLENVVKHNIINENNIVDVKITSEENYIVIENNKILKSLNVENSKKGIENIKQRIAYFTDDKVIIKDSDTHFVIQLPILETI